MKQVIINWISSRFENEQNCDGNGEEAEARDRRAERSGEEQGEAAEQGIEHIHALSVKWTYISYALVIILRHFWQQKWFFEFVKRAAAAMRRIRADFVKVEQEMHLQNYLVHPSYKVFVSRLATIAVNHT